MNELLKFSIPKEEIPFMISEDLNIITMPREKDPETIMFCGDKSTGKTMSFLNYIGGLHSRQQHVFIANDRAPLSQSWNHPQDNKRFIEILKIAGLKPSPLPIVQLHPSKKHFIPPIEYDIDYIKIALSWEVVLDNFRDFFKFDRSEPYFEELIPQLKTAASFTEIKSIVTSTVGSKDAEKSIARKIIAKLAQFWDSKIIDISTDDVVSNILVRKKIAEGIEITKEFSAEIGLMYAGVIPTLVTAGLNKQLMNIYLKNQLLSIFENQSCPGWFRDNKKVVYIAIDEMQVLEKRFEETREALEMIALEGRNRRIALLYCAQNIATIPSEVADNTRYGFCLNQSGEGDIKKLRDLFNLSKTTTMEMKTLNKENMEMIACTKEKFHAYDMQSGKKMVIRGEPVKGMYLPPLCQTVPPRE